MAELIRYSGTFSDSFPTNDEIEAVDAGLDVPAETRSEIPRGPVLDAGPS